MRLPGLLIACLSVPCFIAWIALPDSSDPADRCAGVSGLRVNMVKQTEATLTWSTSANAVSTDVQWREDGGAWNEIPDAESPLVLDGLSSCASYELQVRAVCVDGPGAWSSGVIFEADGCCRIPTGFVTIAAQNESLDLTWDSVAMAKDFSIRYRRMSTMEWDTVDVTSTGTVISGLRACSAYELQISTGCDATSTDFSEVMIARTTGCGTCTATDYCPTFAYDASYEWIDSVAMSGLRSKTGSDNGYASYATERANLERGRTYPFFARAGFSGEVCPQYFRVWIDLDQDGIFNDSTEMLLDMIDESGSGVSVPIALPPTTPLGVTRMRVAMVPVSTMDTIQPTPCGIYDFGEVEDYCIRIGDVCPFPVVFDTLSTTETSATIGWSGTDKAIAYLYQYMEVGEMDGETDVTEDTTLVLDDLKSCTDYLFVLVTICIQDTQVTTLPFSTRCETSTGNIPEFLNEMTVYPNPFSKTVTVEIEASRNLEGRLEFADVTGRMLYSEQMNLTAGNRQTAFISAVEQLPASMYYVLYRSEGQVAVQKIIKAGY